ncbi:MAG: NifB/NifX family molybdenum-iron cluster-binding protein [archaeon]
MKIAIASDDKKTISHHFGKALGFVVYDIQNGKAINNEYRQNIGKSNGECGSCNHSTMIENIKDCKTVICYGMGQRIYDDLQNAGVAAFVTDETNVENAVKKYLSHSLINRTEKLH